MEQKINLKSMLPLNEAILFILLALFEAQESDHILHTIQRDTKKRVKLSQPQLIGILEKLQAKHLVVKMNADEKSNAPKTRYIITPLGKEIVRLEFKRLRSLTKDIQKVLHKDDRLHATPKNTQN